MVCSSYYVAIQIGRRFCRRVSVYAQVGDLRKENFPPTRLALGSEATKGVSSPTRREAAEGRNVSDTKDIRYLAAHKLLLETRATYKAPSAELKAIQDEQDQIDVVHDRMGRGLHAILTALAEVTG